jgi:hypothetical protein
MADGGRNVLVFEVKEGKRITQFKRQFRDRGDLVEEQMDRLISRAPEKFEDKRCYACFGDLPSHFPAPDFFDIAFCSTRMMGQEEGYVPMACPYALSWKDVGIEDTEKMLQRFLVEEVPIESSKIFWIGANTHSSRVKLHRLGQRYPDLLDVRMTDWKEQQNEMDSPVSEFVSLSDHRRYKYLIDCPGYGYSGRLKWLLATGRPVFVVEREFVEHWHEELEPWVNYVPVYGNLSALMRAYERLEKEEGLAESIGRAGREFARENLNLETQFERTLKGMTTI